DENKDHSCDICGATTECADENKDHKCDLCGKAVSECADENKDHTCDICGATGIGGDCADAEDDEDHNCDYCGKNLCADENKDHVCDGCSAQTKCSDADLDDRCDVCNVFIFNAIGFDTGIESAFINGYIFVDGVFVRASEVDAAVMNAATPTRFLYSKEAFKIRISPTMKETEKEGYVTFDLTNNKKEGNYYTLKTRINHDAGTTGNDVVRISFADANGNAAYSFIVTTATGAKMRLYSESGLDVTTDVARAAWFDVAVEVYSNGDKSTIKLYVNGVLAYEGEIAIAADAAIEQIRIDSLVPGSGKAASIHFDDFSFSRTAESVYVPAAIEE
ncbi:MAG: hypothetical protein IJF55_00690, partial [Clostridia bacterium]|nr:hypothetical protein [Clostridia bacterium]